MKKILLCLLIGLLAACSTVGGNTKPEKQSLIEKMERDTLAELFKKQPLSQVDIRNGKAYAVFSNVNINLLLVAAGSGYGILREKNQKPVYMKMAEVGIGPGAGAKDFKLILIFNDKQALESFKQGNLNLAGNADVVAKSGEKGGGASVEGATNKVKIYTLTQTGLALQATVKGTKYSIDTELN